jgi:membrane protein implicated in regulation of membrane protease activity
VPLALAGVRQPAQGRRHQRRPDRRGDDPPGAQVARARGVLVLGKYTLLQLPGWIAVGGAAWAAHRWLGLEAWLAAGAFAAWFLKDALLFPFVRHAYELEPRPPAAALLGAEGVAQDALAPEGFVRVGAELWRARLAAGEAPVAAGAPVRVVAVEGLTLRVRGA